MPSEGLGNLDRNPVRPEVGLFTSEKAPEFAYSCLHFTIIVFVDPTMGASEKDEEEAIRKA